MILVTDAVPETIEASLQLSEASLSSGWLCRQGRSSRRFTILGTNSARSCRTRRGPGEPRRGGYEGRRCVTGSIEEFSVKRNAARRYRGPFQALAPVTAPDKASPFRDDDTGASGGRGLFELAAQMGSERSLARAHFLCRTKRGGERRERHRKDRRCLLSGFASLSAMERGLRRLTGARRRREAAFAAVAAAAEIEGQKKAG